ncbi:MAG: hypothetical protein A2138_02500 [Deltaproteobacteria bacterium RBG_16_71_12]|nr:MAG: hypothetical protein A2138_02500 [Deltaproteobacteria bacterium RBG_16_71_12]
MIARAAGQAPPRVGRAGAAIAMGAALAFGLAAPARADGDAAAALIDEARARYQAVEYDTALGILERPAALEALDDAGRARVRAFAGLVRAQMADDAGARSAFAEALALDLCVALPDVPATPRIIAMFAEERARAHGARGTAAAPVTAPTAPPSQQTTSPMPVVAAAAALGGAGAVSLVAAGAFGAMALATHADANAAEFQSDAVTKAAQARDQALVGNTLLALGVVLVVGAGGAAALALVPGT